MKYALAITFNFQMHVTLIHIFRENDPGFRIFLFFLAKQTIRLKFSNFSHPPPQNNIDLHCITILIRSIAPLT